MAIFETWHCKQLGPFKLPVFQPLLGLCRVPHKDIPCNSVRMPNNQQTSFNCFHVDFAFYHKEEISRLAAFLQRTPCAHFLSLKSLAGLYGLAFGARLLNTSRRDQAAPTPVLVKPGCLHPVDRSLAVAIRISSPSLCFS